jgi:hypothetical protein
MKEEPKPDIFKESTLNKEESYWFVRWVFMRKKYKDLLLETEELRSLETSKLHQENKRLQEMLTKLRLEMFPENKTKRVYKKKKK